MSEAEQRVGGIEGDKTDCGDTHRPRMSTTQRRRRDPSGEKQLFLSESFTYCQMLQGQVG